MKSKNTFIPPRVNFISLGCAKNLLDSEKMLARLAEAQMLLVGPDDPADVTIINTCSFIQEARQEAFEAINEALDAKRAGLTRYVIVVGCLAQHWADRLKRHLPHIDAVMGLSARDEISRLVKQLLNDNDPGVKNPIPVLVEPFRGPIKSDRGRLRLTEPCWAYLRISDGCSRGCSFCTIGRIRGPYRSKDPDEIIAEAAELIADGVLELNLIGQETSSYGIDIGHSGGLAQLLFQLNKLDHLRWIRLLYVHPATLCDDQIDAMARCEKVVPYLDIPLKHINDRILNSMNRRITRSRTEELLKKLRARIDNPALRTTMMVGFPTETDAEFEELLDFVREYRFEALGAFMYSAEVGTPAAKIKGAVSQKIKKQRWEKLMRTQQEIAFAQAEAMAGKNVSCLLLKELSETEVNQLQLSGQKRWFTARHARQGPEIDSVCFVAADIHSPVKVNQITQVTITGRRDYDLIGHLQPQ